MEPRISFDRLVYRDLSSLLKRILFLLRYCARRLSLTAAIHSLLSKLVFHSYELNVEFFIVTHVLKILIEKSH